MHTQPYTAWDDSRLSVLIEAAEHLQKCSGESFHEM